MKPMILLIFAGLLFGAGWLQAGEPEARSVMNLEGERLPTEDILGGKATVVVFLGQECPISRRYIPRLNELSTLAHEQGLGFVGVFSDSWATLKSSQTFRDDYEIRFDLILDDRGELASALKPLAKPEVFVLEASDLERIIYRGRIDDRFAAIGRLKQTINHHELFDAIQAAAKNQKPAVAKTQPIGCFFDPWPTS